MHIIIFQQIQVMLIIMIVGVICYKTKLITKEGNKGLSNLLLFVINPIMVFMSFRRPYEAELFRNFMIVIGLSTLSYAITIPLARLLVAQKNKEFAIERFSAVYSNAGFFGIPLINSVFGLNGVFYLTAYLTMFNILIWSHGILLMRGKSERPFIKDVLRNSINPSNVAIVIGFIVFLFSISLPERINAGIDYLGNMNTPLAMLVAGVTLAQADLKEILVQKRVYYVAAIKLILFPVIIALVLKLLGISGMLAEILVIVNACPVAATGTLFAIRYEKNSGYASSLYVVTTLLSVATMPFIMYLYQLFS